MQNNEALANFEMEARHSKDRLQDGVRLIGLALEYLQAHPEDAQQQCNDLLTFVAQLNRETRSLYDLIYRKQVADALAATRTRYGVFYPQPERKKALAA